MEAAKASGSKPRTRGRVAEEERIKQEEKRRRTQFQPRKMIGPNDIIVNRSVGKIKIEQEFEVKFDVTQEIGNQEMAIDPLRNQNSSNDFPEVRQDGSVSEYCNKSKFLTAKEKMNVKQNESSASSQEQNKSANLGAGDAHPEACLVVVKDEVNLPMDDDYDDVSFPEPTTEVPLKTHECSSCREKEIKIQKLLEMVEQLKQCGSLGDSISLNHEQAEDKPIFEKNKIYLAPVNHPSSNDSSIDPEFNQNKLPSESPPLDVNVGLDDPNEIKKQRQSLSAINTLILFAQVVPLMLSHMGLRKMDLLNCRAVCKNWKIAMDRVLDNHPARQPHDADTLSKVKKDAKYFKFLRLTYDPFWTHMTGTDGIREKIKCAQDMQYRNLPIPLFVGRSVKFYYGGENYRKTLDSNEYYYENMSSFASIFGTDIWHASFEISLGANGGFIADNYMALNALLDNVPNLKSMHLLWNFYRCPDVRNEQLVEMASFLQKHVLPELRDLEVLSFCGENPKHDMYNIQIIRDFQNAVFKKYSNQIRKLTTSFDILSMINVKKFENLVDLQLRIKSRNYCNASLNLTSLMENLNMPRLEKLALCRNSKNPLEILGGIQKLNVKTLKIDYHDKGGSFSYPTNFVPTLTSVTTLNISMTFTDLSSNNLMHILTFLPKLEYLKFISNSPRSTMLNQFDIWKLLPNLKMHAIGQSKKARQVFRPPLV